MRFSTIAALVAAPLLVAGRLQGRTQHGSLDVVVGGKQHEVTVTSTTIIIIWVNLGGGASTSQYQETTMPVQSTHTIKVGGAAGLVYVPEQTTAAVGDLFIFEFLSKNHTVTQSPFDTPCKKIEGGLDSGFIANPDNSIVPAPQMAMQLTTDKPLWFYCRQATHCGKGMVFSINAPTTGGKTHADFKNLAIQQNGTGAVPPIAGGSGAPSSAPPAATSAPAASTEAPAASTATSSSPVATGIGNVGGDGSCSCSCLCGVASFPNAGIQGRGHWGGLSGAIPMAALEK